MEKYTFSEQVGVLVISLFVAGFCVGFVKFHCLRRNRLKLYEGLFCGGLCRKSLEDDLYLLSRFSCTWYIMSFVSLCLLPPSHNHQCFQIGMALSQNTASLLVFRFLGGVFAAGPLTNSG